MRTPLRPHLRFPCRHGVVRGLYRQCGEIFCLRCCNQKALLQPDSGTEREERVKALPRYKPIEGYEPGVYRVPPVFADGLTVDPRSSRELRDAYTPAPGENKWTFKGGHPGPERGLGSGRGYNARMNPWRAVGTPKHRVKPRRVDPVCKFRKRKVRRA